MADNSDNGFLYFMVGVLIIGLIGLGYFYYNGTPSRSVNNTTVIENTTTEKVPAYSNQSGSGSSGNTGVTPSSPATNNSSGY